MAEEITREEYVAQLNRFATPEIAQLFKVSEAAVETWKAGDPNGWPIQWAVIVRILNEKGHPVA